MLKCYIFKSSSSSGLGENIPTKKDPTQHEGNYFVLLKKNGKGKRGDGWKIQMGCSSCLISRIYGQVISAKRSFSNSKAKHGKIINGDSQGLKQLRQIAGLEDAPVIWRGIQQVGQIIISPQTTSFGRNLLQKSLLASKKYQLGVRKTQKNQRRAEPQIQWSICTFGSVRFEVCWVGSWSVASAK